MRNFGSANSEKNGKDKEAFRDFQKTNRNSLQFSVFASIMILVTCVFDLILYLAFTGFHLAEVIAKNEIAVEEVTEDLVLHSSVIATALGFGMHLKMLRIIPVLFLFSYTRTYKDSMGDRIIPVAGIIVTAFVVLETLYRVIVLNLPAILRSLGEAAEAIGPL